MGQILVRNLSDDVLSCIKAKARANGKSAEQLVRETLSKAFSPSREELARRLEAVRSGLPAMDLQTTLRIMQEAREERDQCPALPDLEPDDH